MRQAFQSDVGKRRPDEIERIGKLEAPLGVVVGFVSDQIAVLVADIGDDEVVLLDLLAHARLVRRDVVPAGGLAAAVLDLQRAGPLGPDVPEETGATGGWATWSP